jgi:hypothetical protein
LVPRVFQTMKWQLTISGLWLSSLRRRQIVGRHQDRAPALPNDRRLISPKNWILKRLRRNWKLTRRLWLLAVRLLPPLRMS